ncbi:MAG TPA: CocE/NonD family hydrolase [Candidatus Acidoferrum sp.]|nr:CocE/NonD family hydrolase [Candidatus Acidoferrum sp.]
MFKNRRAWLAARFVLLVAAGVLAYGVRAQDIVVTEMRIPTHASGKKGLEAVMVRPGDSAPHPLALMTHGTPREASEREEMTPLRWIPQAREFARRGWTAVIVMRRGFGDSGGGYDEDGRACSRNPDFIGPTKEAVKDLREAAAYLAGRPEVDPSRMISIGVSTGGLAMVGLSADPPPGLMAAISFAGGRGSRAPDDVCNAGILVSAFGEFGKHSKVPMLWVYAENDHFFGPQLARAFYQAFTHNGGKARFIPAGPFGEDGHGLFSLRGIPTWTPMVDDFLQSENLVLRETPLVVHPPDAEPPEYLSSQGREEFRRYLLSAPHKAFAASPGGGVGMYAGRRTTQDAEKHALENCKKAAPKNEACAIVMMDDEKTPN